MLELLAYITIAIIIMLRLYTLLGATDDNDTQGVQHSCADADCDDEMDDGTYRSIANSEAQMPWRDLELESKILSKMDVDTKQRIEAISAIDNKFNLTSFIDGAQHAFDTVLGAYSTGNVAAVSEILSDAVLQKVKSKVTNASERERCTIISFKDIAILGIELAQHVATIKMKFITEQVRFTEDAKGKVVRGSKKARIMIEDIWTLQRDVSQANPNWKLVAVS